MKAIKLEAIKGLPYSGAACSFTMIPARQPIQFVICKRYPGFTLVELLVVISIIALIIGILLPVLGKARSAGNQAVCMSNMRQAAIARSVYANDFEQSVPVGEFLASSNTFWSLPAGTPLRSTGLDSGSDFAKGGQWLWRSRGGFAPLNEAANSGRLVELNYLDGAESAWCTEPGSVRPEQYSGPDNDPKPWQYNNAIFGGANFGQANKDSAYGSHYWRHLFVDANRWNEWKNQGFAAQYPWYTSTLVDDNGSEMAMQFCPTSWLNLSLSHEDAGSAALYGDGSALFAIFAGEQEQIFDAIKKYHEAERTLFGFFDSRSRDADLYPTTP